jgi:hypothetical protein
VTSTPFEPTDEQRRTVRAMSGFGVPRNDIATHVGVEPWTLLKHFTEGLDRGSTEATDKAAQSLFQMATQGNNVSAAIFWMKARAGWSEKNQVELTGPDGGPLLLQMSRTRVRRSWRCSVPPGSGSSSRQTATKPITAERAGGVHHRPTTVDRW